METTNNRLTFEAASNCWFHFLISMLIHCHVKIQISRNPKMYRCPTRHENVNKNSESATNNNELFNQVNYGSSVQHTRANTALAGCAHPPHVSFAPPSWDAPDLHRAPPLPSLANFVYLNVFCAAASAAQFWGWSFMSFAFKWNFMDQRGLIADPGSALPPLKCFLWIWIWVLVVGPSTPMPHLQHTQCTLPVHRGYTKLTFLLLFWKFLNVFWYIWFCFCQMKYTCHQSANSCCYLLKSGQPESSEPGWTATDRHRCEPPNTSFGLPGTFASCELMSICGSS